MSSDFEQSGKDVMQSIAEAHAVFDEWYFSGSGRSQPLLPRDEWEPLVLAIAEAIERAKQKREETT